MTLQIPGSVNGAKLLFVAMIWTLILTAFAVVTGTLNRQWFLPPDISQAKTCILNNCKAADSDCNRDDQCERLNFAPCTLGGAVLEVENTWSNAAYLMAGMLVLLTTYRPLGYLVGTQLCVLAFLSGMYHGTLQDNWQTFDVASIYFILWALLFYGLQAALDRRPDRDRRGWLEWVIAGCLGLGSTLLSWIMATHRKGDSRIDLFDSTTATFTFVTALIVLCAYQMARRNFNWGSAGCLFRLWTEPGCRWWEYLCVWRIFWRERTDTEWNLRSYLWGFAITGGISLPCRFLDGIQKSGAPKALCHPGWKIQPHALWHVFGALTLLLAYDFFAWSGGLDYPVFVRKKPDGPNPSHSALAIKALGIHWDVGPLYQTAIVAFTFGAALLALTLFTDQFVGDDAHATGVCVSVFFLLLAIALWVLRFFGVIDDPTD